MVLVVVPSRKTGPNAKTGFSPNGTPPLTQASHARMIGTSWASGVFSSTAMTSGVYEIN